MFGGNREDIHFAHVVMKVVRIAFCYPPKTTPVIQLSEDVFDLFNYKLLLVQQVEVKSLPPKARGNAIGVN